MNYIVKNHKTEYFIYLSMESSQIEKDASLFLKKYFDLAFNTDIKVLSTRSNKFIEIRQSSLDGVSFYNKEDNLIIGGSGLFGPFDAVVEFLNKYIGFEIYANDAITYKKRANLCVKDFHYIPSFKYRIASYGWIRTNDSLKRMTRTISNDELFITGNSFHNAFDIIRYNSTNVKDDWLSADKKQLCYSNAEMRKQFVINLKQYLKNDNKCNIKNHYFVLGMEDNLSWCKCDNCLKMSPSDLMVDFVNYVENEINKESDNAITFLLFAYYNTIKAPINIKCNSRVGVIFAPIKMNFRKPLKFNKEYLNELEKWSKCTNTLFCWTYNFYTRRNFFSYNTFESMPLTYKSLFNNGAKFIYDQTESYSMNQTGFCYLKAYMQQKLMWDVNVSYSKLVNNFFDNYFGNAAKTMKKIYQKTINEYKRIYKNENKKFNSPEFEIDPNVYSEIGQVMDDFNSIDIRFKTFIDKTNDILDSLLNSSSLSSDIKNRILIESVQYKYWKVLLDKKINTNIDFTQLLETLKTLGITHYQEGKVIEKNIF